MNNSVKVIKSAMTEENVEQEMSEGFDKYVLCNKDVSQTDQQHFLLCTPGINNILEHWIRRKGLIISFSNLHNPPRPYLLEQF